MPGVEGGEDRADWRALKETGEAASLGRQVPRRGCGAARGEGEVVSWGRKAVRECLIDGGRRGSRGRDWSGYGRRVRNF